MTSVASFDVFDTVLTRAIGSPESNFLLLGKKLRALSLIDCSAEMFARSREQAESRAFFNAGGLDSRVNLRQIYAELGMALGFSNDLCDCLLDLEVQHELEIIRPVPRAQELVQEARSQNNRIAYLSDMYLGSEQVRKLLIQHGLYYEHDRCYVSCDYGKSKDSSLLFQEVLKREQIAPHQMTHCGNNSWADIHMAEKVGIRTIPFLEGNLNRYEKVLESYTWSTEGLSSALAGASRLARLTIPTSSPNQEALRDVAAGVTAPTIVSFVLWVLESARKLNLKRLYFVSRDGQTLLEIARRLIKKLNFDCELRYLYGSRQAWMLPSVTRVDEEHLKGIFIGKLNLDIDFVSAQIALARLCIEPFEVKNLLETIGLPEGSWSRNLSPNERCDLSQLVLENSQMQDLILRKSQEKRQVMVKYLRQEGLLDPVEFGLVDLGTGASLHYALSEVIQFSGGKPPISFYQGLRAEIPRGQFANPLPYLFEAQHNLGVYEHPGNGAPTVNVITEIACCADHGTVLDYRDLGNTVVPVLKEETNRTVMDWGYALVRETMYCFADHLLLDPKLVNTKADLRAACKDVCRAFWLEPSVIEAEAWGRFPMEDGWGDKSFYNCIADSYRWRDVIPTFWNGHFPGRRHWWHHGAFALTPLVLRQVLKVSYRMGSFQRQLRGRLSLGQRVKKIFKSVLAFR